MKNVENGKKLNGRWQKNNVKALQRCQKILSTMGNGSSTSNINNSSLKNHEGHSCDIIDNTGVYDE